MQPVPPFLVQTQKKKAMKIGIDFGASYQDKFDHTMNLDSQSLTQQAEKISTKAFTINK